MSEIKHNPIDLHADRKRTLLIVALFLLLSAIISILAIVTLNMRCVQWFAFLKSDYDYSFVTSNKVKSDSYYKLDAGIVFALSKDSLKGINSEVLMQCDGDYTSIVTWNARERLKTNEIAISGGIAKKYCLKEGDKLYSKHIVDSATVEYTIQEIIPAISRSRGMHSTGSSDGLIIMGCDSKYLDNIKHVGVVFSNESMNSLAAEGFDINDIIYRDDEVIAEMTGTLPYLGIMTVMTVCLTVGMTYFLIREMRQYYRRLISIGVSAGELKRAYYHHTGITGFMAIAASAGIMIVLFGIFGSIKVGVLVQGMLFLIEIITVFATMALINRRLWRS